MQDEPDYQQDEQEQPQEQPLDFSQPAHLCRCPYCSETLSSEEIKDSLAPGGNSFICPNCRKRLNIDELGSSI